MDESDLKCILVTVFVIITTLGTAYADHFAKEESKKAFKEALKALEEGEMMGVGEKYAVVQNDRCIVRLEEPEILRAHNIYCIIDYCPNKDRIAFRNPTACGTLYEVLEAPQRDR